MNIYSLGNNIKRFYRYTMIWKSLIISHFYQEGDSLESVMIYKRSYFIFKTS